MRDREVANIERVVGRVGKGVQVKVQALKERKRGAKVNLPRGVGLELHF